MGHLVAGLSHHLFFFKAELPEKGAVDPYYLVSVDINDRDRIAHAVQCGLGKFVGTLQFSGAFGHALFEGFIQRLELLLRLLYLGDGVLGEIDHNIYEDRAAEKNSSSDQFNGKLEIDEQDDVEEDITGKEKVHEVDNGVPPV